MKTMTFLLALFFLSNCHPGWSIGGYELTPSDTLNSVYIEIVAHDSTQHWYADKVIHGDNWCLLHDQWEDVRIK